MTFQVLRAYILFICKIISIFIYILLLIKANEYTIQWNLLTWVFPSVTSSINSMLSTIGLYIVAIPLTIVILSLLIPESLPLTIISGFFGVISLVISLIINISLKGIGTVYNMKIFLVTKVLTLDDKIKIFLMNFKTILDERYNNNTPAKYLDYDFVKVYYNALETMTNLDQIKLYAYKCAEPLFEKTVVIQRILPASDYWYIFKMGMSIIVIGGVLYIAYRYLTGLADVAELASQGQQITTDGLQSSLDLSTQVHQLTTVTSALNTRISNLEHFKSFSHSEFITLNGKVTSILTLLQQCLDALQIKPPFDDTFQS
jgi:hypothetical protein